MVEILVERMDTRDRLVANDAIAFAAQLIDEQARKIGFGQILFSSPRLPAFFELEDKRRVGAGALQPGERVLVDRYAEGEYPARAVPLNGTQRAACPAKFADRVIPTGFGDTDIFAYAVVESIVRERGDQLVARIAALGRRLRGVEAKAADLPYAFAGRRLAGAKMRIDVAEQVRRR